MTEPRITRVAVVGTGVIGASWASYFLARGLEVIATDPAPGAEDNLRADIARHWHSLTLMGLAPGASQDKLSFTSDLEAAVSEAQFVQENGPERLDIKIDLLRRLDSATQSQVIIASSSSGLMISQVQGACRHPGRILLGHPFNPPHLIPLVEVVGGAGTAPEAVEEALDFYTSIGKRPIHLRREVPGHVANRLQAALWREAFHLVDSGVASVADIDTAISHGPGLRWALLGPFLNLHLSGGRGGIEHLLDHLGPAIESWWKDLGAPSLTDELQRKVADGVRQMLVDRTAENIEAQRDALLRDLLHAKSDAPDLP
jgi:carnitine 3-dehydrogenase